MQHAAVDADISFIIYLIISAELIVLVLKSMQMYATDCVSVCLTDKACTMLVVCIVIDTAINISYSSFHFSFNLLLISVLIICLVCLLLLLGSVLTTLYQLLCHAFNYLFISVILRPLSFMFIAYYVYSVFPIMRIY